MSIPCARGLDVLQIHALFCLGFALRGSEVDRGGYGRDIGRRGVALFKFLGGDIRCMVAVCKKTDGRARVGLARDDSSDLTPISGFPPNPAYTKDMPRQDQYRTTGKAVGTLSIGLTIICCDLSCSISFIALRSGLLSRLQGTDLKTRILKEQNQIHATLWPFR